MAHAALLAEKLAVGLNALHCECTRQGTAIKLPKWGLRIDVVEGKTKQGPDGTFLIQPTIVAGHRFLPMGHARELCVGTGATVNDAAQSIAGSWLLLFFPLMKFLFEAKPQDSLVRVERVVLPQVAGLGYRLVAGPVQMVGAVQSAAGEQPAASAKISQLLLWESFADLLIPKLTAGVHHVRCYAGMTPSGPKADVFVDGSEWEAGSERFRTLAAQFKWGDDTGPIHALKQHLLFRPDDLALGMSMEEARQIGVWDAALHGRLATSDAELVARVLTAIYVMSRIGSQADSKEALIGRGVPADLAAQVTLFLVTAAVRVVLQKHKVQFSPSYYWVNNSTDQAVKRRYDETPVAVAAANVAGALFQQGLARAELARIAELSAEMSAARQGMANGAKLEGMVFTAMMHYTDEPVTGEDLNYLLMMEKRPVRADVRDKPWWKVW